MRLAVALLAGLGAVLGLAATGLVAAAGEAEPRQVALAVASSLLALATAPGAGRGSPRRAAVLLLAVVGLGVAIGEAAYLPGAALLLAALLAWLSR